MVEVKHLWKTYDTYTAVRDLTFTFEQGHIYGFLGPNGAGKSTTMNIITGCLAATSGEVTIGGYDIFEHPREAKKLIGYLPEIPPVYVDQSVREYLTFACRAKGFKKSEVADEVWRVATEANITNVIDKIIKHLSKGYRQRVGVAQALIGNPPLIILDEPTVGLDPMQIIDIRDFIRALGQKHTVILSSHILSEVQSVCDRVLIIRKGRMVAFDRPENLGKTLKSGNRIEIAAVADQAAVQAAFGSIPGVTEIEFTTPENPEDIVDGVTTATLHVGTEDPGDICALVFDAASKSGIIMRDLHPVKITLEDIFIELTAGRADEVPDDSEVVTYHSLDEKEAAAQ